MKNLYKAVPARLPISIAICASLLSFGAIASETEGAATALPDDFSLAHIPMKFRNGATHMRTVSNINGAAIIEGDILLGEADHFFNNTKKRTALGLSNFTYGVVWPNGVVPFSISDQLSEASVKKIRSAVQRWNDTGAISLIERTAGNADAYPNFVNFIEASQCASFVGFQNDGGQSIYAGDKCSEGSMIHEIGHAIGLLHEHTRPDRDNYVLVSWDSIKPDKAHNFDILGDAISLGPYDYNSIMHYGTHFFSESGKATITPMQTTDATIGQREFISEGDEQSVKDLYATELTVVSAAPSNAVAGETMEVEMYVTNNADMGANRLILNTAVPEGAQLVSFSSSSWICQQSDAGEDVVCQAPVLAKNQSSTVSISLETQSVGILAFDTTLSSNTFDTDLSNNNDQSTIELTASQGAIATADLPILQKEIPQVVVDTTKPEPEPVLGAANPEVASASGGGAFGALGLIPLLLRRKRNVGTT